jgi:ribonuclease P protein component
VDEATGVVADLMGDLAADRPLSGQWLGMVVPKKHARRAVTRNLIKREMRATMASAGAALPAGLWVLRLKAPFDRQVFTSPGSALLLQAARDELLLLLQRAAAPRR